MLPLLVAIAATLVLAPVVRAVMLHQGVLDLPNHRSSHTAPVPRGGGLACLGGVVAATAVSASTGRPVPWVAVALAVCMSAVGLVDDRLGVPALPRLAIQAGAGAATGWALGGAVWALAGLVVVPVAVNVVNFMDAINGITGMHGVLWGLVTTAVAYGRGLPIIASLALATVGMCAGFLPWNAPRARLFLGDSGSYLLGGLVAGCVLLTARTASPHDVGLVVAPLFLYLVDTGTALVRRFARGASLTEAHREHVCQVLSNEVGLPHVIVSAIGVLLAALSTAAWAWTPWFVALPALVVIAVTYLALPALVVAVPGLSVGQPASRLAAEAAPGPPSLSDRRAAILARTGRPDSALDPRARDMPGTLQRASRNQQ